MITNVTTIDGHRMHVASTYTYDGEPPKTLHAEFELRPDMTVEDCDYWAASSDGEVRGWKGIGGTCLASLESAYHGLGLDVYCIWRPKNHRESDLRRWTKKWTARLKAPNTGSVFGDPSIARAR